MERPGAKVILAMLITLHISATEKLAALVDYTEHSICQIKTERTVGYS
jgi:hypothetical protein